MKRRSFWPCGIALIYGLFAAAMIGFVVFAVRHPTDLVSKDYYREEIAHQERIDSERRGSNDPDAPTVAVQDRMCVIHFSGTPPAAGSINLYRPSDARLDRMIPMDLDHQQNQTLNLTDISTGLWRLRIEWTRNGQNYFREELCMLKK